MIGEIKGDKLFQFISYFKIQRHAVYHAGWDNLDWHIK